jgi:Flp pilus assembly pilin Flp
MRRFTQLLFVLAVLPGRVRLLAALGAQRRQAAQGLVEYAVILVLVAIVVIGGVTQTGRRISSTYKTIDCTLAGNYGTTTVSNNAPPGQGGVIPGQGGSQPYQGGSSTTGCLTP